MIEATIYQKHMNLRIAAGELGIPIPTLYARLKKAGIKVIGDKLRHGSDRDRLGAKAEHAFRLEVPYAKPLNDHQFQYKVDFDVNGWLVDVKASSVRYPQKRHPNYEAWMFSFKKQSLLADFVCCYCMDKEANTAYRLLVPSEFFKGIQTVTVPVTGDSKWKEFQTNSFLDFFDELGIKAF